MSLNSSHVPDVRPYRPVCSQWWCLRLRMECQEVCFRGWSQLRGPDKAWQSRSDQAVLPCNWIWLVSRLPECCQHQFESGCVRLLPSDWSGTCQCEAGLVLCQPSDWSVHTFRLAALRPCQAVKYHQLTVRWDQSVSSISFDSDRKFKQRRMLLVQAIL